MKVKIPILDLFRMLASASIEIEVAPSEAPKTEVAAPPAQTQVTKSPAEKKPESASVGDERKLHDLVLYMLSAHGKPVLVKHIRELAKVKFGWFRDGYQTWIIKLGVLLGNMSRKGFIVRSGNGATAAVALAKAYQQQPPETVETATITPPVRKDKRVQLAALMLKHLEKVGTATFPDLDLAAVSEYPWYNADRLKNRKAFQNTINDLAKTRSITIMQGANRRRTFLLNKTKEKSSTQ